MEGELCATVSGLGKWLGRSSWSHSGLRKCGVELHLRWGGTEVWVRGAGTRGSRAGNRALQHLGGGAPGGGAEQQDDD